MADATPSAFPWKIMEPAKAEWQQRILLLYGPSGVGKTRLAAQFPSPLLLSCDPGASGGATSALEFGVKQLKISSYSQMNDLLPKLKESAGTEFKTLILDSVTYMGKMVLANILTAANREIARFEEWGLNYARTARLINTLADLKCHIIFTAIDKMDKDEVTGKISYGPALPGQLTKELPQAVDVCARLFTTTGYNGAGKLTTTYKYRVVPDDSWVGKDRTSLLTTEGLTSFDAFKPLFLPEELGANY